MNKIYETKITFRGIEKRISDLKENSKKKINMKCQECDEYFNRYAFVLFQTGNFLCQKCTLKEKFSKHLKKGDTYNYLTVIGASNKSGKSIVSCKCGRIKEIDNFSIKSGHTQSCGCIKSKKIKEYFKINPCKNKGKHHPNWRGGISGERARTMATSKYKEWRLSVFKRDGYKCKKCNVNSNTLEAHHIYEFANNPNKIIEIGNGITFCKSCHKKFHKVYGNTKLNKLHIEAFLKS